MAWVKFNSKKAFRDWHNEIKMTLGYPLDEITNEYTYAKVIATNDIRAWIDDEFVKDLSICEAPNFQSFNDVLYEEIS
jgi:hypothetical protein